MKYIIPIFRIAVLLSIGLFFSTCEDAKVYEGESLEGTWFVIESGGYNDGASYLCKVEAVSSPSSMLKIWNFQDSYGETNPLDERYALLVSIAGNRLTINPQTVDDVTIYLSSGLIYSDESFKIEYSYSLSGEEGMKTYNATASFVREN